MTIKSNLVIPSVVAGSSSGGGGGGGDITVDSELSTTSTNPVQNKIITSALAGKLDLSGGTLTDWLTLAYDEDDPTSDSTIVMPGGLELYSTAPYIFLNPTQEEPQPIEYASLSMLGGIEVAGARDYSGTTSEDGYDYDNYRAQISLNPQYGTTKLELLSDSNNAPQLYRTYMDDNTYVSENVAWLDSNNKILANQLPAATANTLGGIKVGNGLSITEDGTLSSSGGSVPANVYTQDNLIAGDGIQFAYTNPKIQYSGFGKTANFIQIPINLANTNDWEISGTFTTGPLTDNANAQKNYYIFGKENYIDLYIRDYKIYIDVGNGNNAWVQDGIRGTTTITPYTKYWFKYKHDVAQGKYIVSLSTDNILYNTEIENSNSSYTYNTTLNVGSINLNINNTYGWDGSIIINDLKITTGSMIVFDGDTAVKNTDYTINGTLTETPLANTVRQINAVNNLTDEVMVSGFSASNGIKMLRNPFAFVSDGSDWEFIIPVEPTNISQALILGNYPITDKFGINILGLSGRLRIYISSDGENWDIANSIDTQSYISNNVKTYIKIARTSGVYTLATSTDGTTYTTGWTSSANQPVVYSGNDYSPALGIHIWSGGSHHFTGTLYLSETTFKSGYNVIFNGKYDNEYIVIGDPTIIHTSSNYATTRMDNLTTQGKIKVTNLVAPSNTYIALTPADGETYTAPADGWFYGFGITTGSNAAFSFYLVNNNETILTSMRGIPVNVATANNLIGNSFPVKKGDKVLLSLWSVGFSYGDYTNLGLRFYYLEGNKSEYTPS